MKKSIKSIKYNKKNNKRKSKKIIYGGVCSTIEQSETDLIFKEIMNRILVEKKLDEKTVADILNNRYIGNNFYNVVLSFCKNDSFMQKFNTKFQTLINANFGKGIELNNEELEKIKNLIIKGKRDESTSLALSKNNKSRRNQSKTRSKSRDTLSIDNCPSINSKKLIFSKVNVEDINELPSNDVFILTNSKN